MLLRIFTLRFDTVLNGFDDGEVRDFLKDREVLSVRDHFFVKDETPYVAVIVTYNLLQPETDRPSISEHSAQDRREEWRALLEESDWPIFNALRDWRNGKAREEGIPPYVICTNRQLAQIAHRRLTSLSKLATVEGLGKAKIERYGAALVQIVASNTPTPEDDVSNMSVPDKVNQTDEPAKEE